MNQSFFESIKKKLEKDAAANLTFLFTQYEKHLKIIEATSDVSDAMMTESPVKTSNTLSLSSTAHSATDGAFLTFPTDPTPSVTVPVSTFSLAGSEVIKQPEDAKSFTFGSIPEKAPSSIFKFAKSNDAKAEQAVAKPITSFSFANQPSASSTVEPLKAPVFNFALPPPIASDDKKPAVFSFGATTLDTKVGDHASSVSLEALPEASSGLSVGQKFVHNDPKPAVSPFSFGKETEGKKASPFAFGATSTTSSAPFQFSFASPLPSFGAKASSSAAVVGKTADDEATDDADGIPAGEEESFTNSRTNTELIKTGAGEEDEKALCEERCKLYMLDKEDGWKDLGIAIIKVNHSEATGKSRIIVRAEGSGKMLLNSWINETMTVEYTNGKKELDVLCVNQAGKIAKYAVRCKEAAIVRAFYEKVLQAKPTH